MTETTTNPPESTSFVKPCRSSTWYARPGIVYFFGAGSPPVAVKIGMTTVINNNLHYSIRRRHSQIQSANHTKIELLGIIRFFDGEYPTRQAEDCEQNLHKRFGQFQLFKAHTRGAEWFKPANEIFEFIEKSTEKLGCILITGRQIS
jgi:hypothetical protein